MLALRRTSACVGRTQLGNARLFRPEHTRSTLRQLFGHLIRMYAYLYAYIRMHWIRVCAHWQRSYRNIRARAPVSVSASSKSAANLTFVRNSSNKTHPTSPGVEQTPRRVESTQSHIKFILPAGGKTRPKNPPPRVTVAFPHPPRISSNFLQSSFFPHIHTSNAIVRRMNAHNIKRNI